MTFHHITGDLSGVAGCEVFGHSEAPLDGGHVLIVSDRHPISRLPGKFGPASATATVRVLEQRHRRAASHRIGGVSRGARLTLRRTHVRLVTALGAAHQHKRAGARQSK